MASQTGLGSCTLWGLTPALNLLTFLDDKTLIEADDDKKAINFLLFGQSDCRHILKTLEGQLSFRTTKRIKINIYLVENTLETYARQLLFLKIASLPTEKMGIYEKTRQYIELFANSHLRPRTQTSLIRLSRNLVKMITDDEYLAQKLPFVNLSEMKFMERDGMVEICKYWSDYCDARKENIADKWDQRLRCHLGTRYDSRVRLFDWDYHMRLVETEGAEIISATEYKRWRNTGMALEDFEADYSQPNVTLVSGASNTTNIKNMRFLGEIITGPFIAYGIECDDKTVFEKANGRFKSSSMDITVHNLEKIFLSLSNIKISVPKEKASSANLNNVASKTPQDGRGDVKDTTSSSNCASQGHEETLANTFTVTFLPMESSKFLYLKSQFDMKFQLVYFSSTMAQNLTPQIARVFAPEAVVIVEGVRHVLELRQEHIEAYDSKVEELALAVNLLKHGEDREDYHRDYLTYSVGPVGSIPDPIPVTTTTATDLFSEEGIETKEKPTDEDDTDDDQIQVIKKPAVTIVADGDYEDKEMEDIMDIGIPQRITEQGVESDSSITTSDQDVNELLQLQKQFETEDDLTANN